MINRRLAVVIGLLVLAATLATANAGRTQQEPVSPGPAAQAAPAQPAGVEVLARGPINEAFAEPVDSRPQPGRVVPKQPPDPIEELPPDQKPAGGNVQWLPGYWGWDDDRNDFIWVSGIWRNLPPGRQWVPGHWVQVASGWQWSPGFWGLPQQQELAFLPPPPEPVPAAAVPAPDNNSVFVPGTWVYRDTRYLWRPGYWLAYRPGWVWIPAHYVWTPAGYVFVDGYWDFELVRRGLLFAPVYVQPGYWTRPNWVYRPDFVVQTDFVLAALFLRPGYNHYYFGDYFEADYRRRGFMPWVDFHRDSSRFDPLYSYYRWQHRDDQRWEGDLRGLYAARYNGTVARPPRTLVQQDTLIRNITVNKNVNVTNTNTVTALTPLTKVNRTVVNLQPVPREQQLVVQKSVQQLRDVSRERARLETQLVAKGSAPVKQADPPRVVQVNLPKPAAAAKVSERYQPPPPPVVYGKPQIRAETGKPPVTPSRPETKPPASAPKPESKPQAKPEAKPQPKPEPKAPAAPPPKKEEKAKPPSDPKKSPEEKAKPPSDPKKSPEAKQEPKLQPQAEIKPPAPAPKPVARPEPKPQPKPEVKPPPKPAPPAPKPQPKPEVKPPPKPAPPAPRPQPGPEAKPPVTHQQPKPEPKAQPRPEARPPALASRQEAKPVPRPQPQPAVKPPSASPPADRRPPAPKPEQGEHKP